MVIKKQYLVEHTNHSDDRNKPIQVLSYIDDEPGFDFHGFFASEDEAYAWVESRVVREAFNSALKGMSK